MTIKKMALPVEAVLEELQAVLAHSPNAVLVAPPGAGKTTRLPLAFLDRPWLRGRVLMLEPRRIAARAAAARLASLSGGRPGGRVGYRTRDDSRVSPATRLEVVTEGILTRMLLEDPALDGYGLLIFDEYHERSLQADAGLALARESQQVLRPDLRILVMSATLDGARVARLLGDCPVVRSGGRSWPVETRHVPPGRTDWLDHAAQVTSALVAERGGTTLAFVPGVGELRRLATALGDSLPAGSLLQTLHGGSGAAEQQAVLSGVAGGTQRVVVATAVAQTSLTLAGVRTVVDCGYERGPAFDPGAGMSRLVTRRVSAATADQRAGRAGREAPGLAVRLWSPGEVLAPFSPPEILAADLTGLALDLLCRGTREPAELAWLDPPPGPAWQAALELLRVLGALDDHGALTEHGRAMQKLPVHPRLAAMILAARERGLADLAARLAVRLEEGARAPGDGVDLARGPGLPEQGRGGTRHRRLRRLGGDPGSLSWSVADIPHVEGQLLAVAYPDRVALRRPGGEPRFLLAGGRGAWLAPEEPLADADCLVAATLDGDPREARIRLAASLDRGLLEELFADRVETVDILDWDRETRAVRAFRERRFGALVLKRETLRHPSLTEVAKALLEGLARHGSDLLPWTPGLRQWQARVQLMHRLEPGNWPDLSDAGLEARAAEWAVPFMAEGIRNWGRFPLEAALRASLDHTRQHRLEKELPVSLEVPSGSRLYLDYTAGAVPVLAVKLQEMFGLRQTPRLAGGRVPLQIHLLSPARRPVAVTADLDSFWRQGYPQVRKDLRGRYPKHAWPEDPLAAVPQAGPRRRTTP